jgi:hypothetical protein
MNRDVKDQEADGLVLTELGSDEHVQQAAEALRHSKTISSLCLKDVRLGGTRFGQIATALKHNTALRRLKLVHCHLGAVGESSSCVIGV